MRLAENVVRNWEDISVSRVLMGKTEGKHPLDRHGRGEMFKTKRYKVYKEQVFMSPCSVHEPR